MSALLLITAAAEPSKVPFFIIGGALAVYAVILATIGIQRPDFPSNAQGPARRDRADGGARRARRRHRHPHLVGRPADRRAR